MSRRPRWRNAPSWDPCIPRLKVKRQGLSAYAFFVVSPAIEGLMTHFVDGKTVVCLEDDCEHCDARRASRWIGYLEVIGNKRAHHLWEVTEGLYYSLWKQVESMDDLRGLHVKCYREWGEKNAPVLGKVHDTIEPPADLPEPLDLREQLKRIWRTDLMFWDQSPAKLDGGFGS